MAPSNKSHPKEFPEHSIRSLDQSTASWPQQIEKACDILEINLASSHEKQCKTSASLDAGGDAEDPRIDWALKWILRNLDPQGEEPNPRSLHHKSWDLFFQLVLRSSVARIAKTLRESKFVEIVHRTFAWMGGESAAGLGQEPAFSKVDVEAVASGESDGGSKKRKRSQEHTQDAARKSFSGGIDVLFTSVCANLFHINCLINKGSEDAGYAVEHLKHAARFPPQAMADILGNAFYVANALIHCLPWLSLPETPGYPRTRPELQKSGYEPCLTPLFDIWNRSTSPIVRSDPRDSHAAFQKNSTVYALLLTHTCSQKLKINTLYEKLRRLLTSHVILHYRQRFSERKKAIKDSEQEGEEMFIQNLSSGMRSRRLTKYLRKQRSDVKAQNHKIDGLLSVLFRLGVESCPRRTPPLRQKEDPWLEALLLDLIRVIEDMRKQGSFADDKRAERRLMRYMLETCDNEKVQLSNETVRNIVRDTSGLFDTDANPRIEWGLISYCLSLDADVFVVPKTQAEGHGKKKQKPNEYLKILLRSLIKNVPDDLKQRHEILRYVVIGLMEGFLKARNLPRFLTLWEKQAGKAIKWRKHLRKERGLSSRLMISVWEDDHILHEAANRLQLLTTTSLKDTISGFSNDLRVHTTFDSRIPQLIILEAVIQSVQSDDQVDDLQDLCGSLLTDVADTMKAKGYPESQDTWRCWRILTSIQQRLRPPFMSGSELSDKHHQLVHSALEMLSGLSKWELAISSDSQGQRGATIVPMQSNLLANYGDSDQDLSDSTIGRVKGVPYYPFDLIVGNPSTTMTGLLVNSENLAQYFHAFSYLATLELSEMGLSEDSYFNKSVNSILNTLEPLCHKIEYDVFGQFQYGDDESKTFTPGSYISTIESLYIGCVSIVISEPRLLSALDIKTQQRLLLQVFNLARWVYRAKEATEYDGLTLRFDWPWKFLLEKLPSFEDKSLHRSILSLLRESYIQTSQFGKPEAFEAFPKDYLFVMESIEQLRPQDLLEEQISQVAYRLCQVLLCYSHRTIGMLEKHVIFQLILLSNLSDPLRPLLDAEAEHKNEEIRDPKINLLFKSLIRNTHSSAIELGGEAIQALRQITRRIIRRILREVDQSTEAEEYLKRVWANVASDITRGQSETSHRLSLRCAVVEVLKLLWEHRTRLIERIGVTATDVQLQRHNLMRTSLSTLPPTLDNDDGRHFIVNLKEPQFRVRLCEEIKNLTYHVDLLRVNPKLMVPGGYYEQLRSLLSRVLSVHEDQALDRGNFTRPSIYPPSYTALRLARLEMALCESDNGLISCILEMAEMLNEEGMSARGVGEGSPVPSFSFDSEEGGSRVPSLSLCLEEERAFLIRNIQKSLLTLDWQQRTILLDRIFHPTKVLRESEFHVTRAIILSDWKEIDGNTTVALSTTFTSICDYLRSNGASNFRTAIIGLQCLAAFLTRHPRNITLNHVTTLLAVITILSRQIQSELTTSRSAHLYTGLTRLTTILLRTFRPQVAHYHHILLPALQSLLHNLFIPYPSSPSTLPQVSSLTVSHATAYARLLTLLCDPTPSSVAPSSRKQKRRSDGLVDQTQKAKNITGEHVQYLIASYCRYQLDGKLESEMKAALSPALWVVLDCIDKSTLRAMGESMNDSGRGVFKALYAEYTRAKESRGR